MIKSFRGIIEDGGQNTIVLHTNDGSTGYRIVKFELFANNPGTQSQESVVQIFKTEQASVPTLNPTVDFSDNTLVGVAYYHGGTGTGDSYDMVVVFDNEIFNQDIFVTHTEGNGTQAVNYYIELEQIKLDMNANTVATLKDIRNAARVAGT